MRRNETMLWTVLAITVMAMAVGYAALAQKLDIKGTASISSKWQVEIIDIQETSRTGQVSVTNKTFDETSAEFNVDLTNPGDKVSFTIKVKNKGTLDAILDTIEVTRVDNPAIIFEISNIKEGDKLSAGATTEIYASVEYSNMVTTQPDATNGSYGIRFVYVQDKGQTINKTVVPSNFSIEKANLTSYTNKISNVIVENGNINLYGNWENYGDLGIIKITLPAQYNDKLDNSTYEITTTGPSLDKTETYNVKSLVSTSEFEDTQYMYLFIQYYDTRTTQTIKFTMDGTEYTYNLNLLQPNV